MQKEVPKETSFLFFPYYLERHFIGCRFRLNGIRFSGRIDTSINLGVEIEKRILGLGIEAIDAIAAATTNLKGIEAVCTGNAIKYLWRWKEKNGVEDLRKATWYIKKLVEEMAKQENVK